MHCLMMQQISNEVLTGFIFLVCHVIPITSGGGAICSDSNPPNKSKLGSFGRFFTIVSGCCFG